MVEIIDAHTSIRFLMLILVYSQIERQRILQGLFNKLRKSDTMIKKLSYSFSVISAAQKLKAVDAVDVLCILYLLCGWYVAKYLDYVTEKSDFKGIMLHAALFTQSGGLLGIWWRRRLLTTFLSLGTNQPVIKKRLDDTAMTASLSSGCRLRTFSYVDDQPNAVIYTFCVFWRGTN
jgi:hypothetical protein